MEVLVPVDCAEEISLMYEAGAREFFCGYMDEAWFQTFNDFGSQKEMILYPINRRHSVATNVTTIEELQRMCLQAEILGVVLFLAVNATFYPRIAYPLLQRYFEAVYQAGIRHLIVSDLGLIQYLHENWPQMKLSISCLNQISNAEAVEFYRQFQPERVVLPRHISVKQAKAIMLAHPQMEFECFALGEKCLFDDGLCRCVHTLGAICDDTWNCTYYAAGEQELTRTELINLSVNEAIFDSWSKEKRKAAAVGCGSNIGCSCCSIATLASLPNMKSWKLSGRGKNKNMIAQRVRITKNVIDMVTNHANETDIRQYIQDVLGKQYCVDYAYCFMRGD